MARVGPATLQPTMRMLRGGAEDGDVTDAITCLELDGERGQMGGNTRFSHY